MGFEKTFDHGDTDLNAMVISQMIFDLLMGQIRLAIPNLNFIKH
jgi:hypothetical protein